MKCIPNRMPKRKSAPKQIRITLVSGETVLLGGGEIIVVTEMTLRSFDASSVAFATRRVGEVVELKPFVEFAKRKTWLGVGAIFDGQC